VPVSGAEVTLTSLEFGTDVGDWLRGRPITGQFELRAGTTNQAGDLVAVGAAISLVTGV
jgi:hypothetical protein